MAVYQEMKESGLPLVGKIPKHWEVHAVKYLASCNDDALPESTDDLFSFDYIDIGSVQNGKGITQLQPMKFKDAPSRARRIVRTDDVIISTVRTYLKAVAMIGFSDTPLVVSTGFAVLRAKNNIYSKFLYYAVLSEYFICRVEAHSVGISYPAINASSICSLKIVTPPMPEQVKIASYLDSACADIDMAIEEAKASIDSLHSYKSSLISQETTSPVWPVWKLRRCVQRIEQGWSSPPAENIDTEDGWFVLTLSAVKQGSFYPFARKHIDANATVPENLALKVNDFLMTRSNTRELVGDVCVVGADVKHTIFSDLIYRITFNENLLPQYAQYVLRSSSVRRQIQSAAHGTSGSMPKISHKVIKEITIPVPPVEEQLRISKYLSEKCAMADSVIEENQSLIADLEAYKKSLIYEVVTGKKKVV